MTPTTLMGLDSTSMVAIAAHHAIGSTVAIRYLSRSTSKVVTKAEVAAYKAGGIALALVFEDGAHNAQGGYDAGKADAEFGLKQAIDICGHPAHVPPRFTLAVDYDPTGVAAATDPYFDGTAAVLGRPNTGPYGGYDEIAQQHSRGFGLLFGTYAWSGGRQFPGMQWFQYSNDHYVGGVGVDYDHCYPDKAGDFGQWDFTPRAPADPYAIYGVGGPYRWKGKLLHEKRVVMRYDVLRAGSRLAIKRHGKELALLRATLKDCADRIVFEAHYENDPKKAHLPPCWRARDLGKRYQGCIGRYRGEKMHVGA